MCSNVRFNIKILISPKFDYRFNATPIKIPSDFLVKIDELILKFIQLYKVPRIAKSWTNYIT